MSGLILNDDWARSPLSEKLEQGLLTQEDYRKLLLNMRQQVIEGSRWITRSASSFDRNFTDVRSSVIRHAGDEHQDYKMLEQDYVAAGGKLEDIQNAHRNPGSEALHGYLMYRASQPNPICMIGAMWIIEGLGEKMATNWSKQVDELFSHVEDHCSSFMGFHGINDADHLDNLYTLLDRVCNTKDDVNQIVTTAKVVARLYVMQLEEVENES